MEYLFGPRVRGTATEFRLWAPSARNLELIVQGDAPVPMESGADGFHRAFAEAAGPGTRYRFRLGDLEFPDPASRQQDGDTAGWSIVRQPLEPSGLAQPKRHWHQTICCEVHVGTATPEGTFAGLRNRLEHYRDAGYTTIELMPVNEFPGARNWGYDGTLVFAPESSYGTPEDLRALVDRAHELELCVELDVVYNHFGEVDNFIPRYAPEWFDPEVKTPWGPGVDFAQPMVRRFYYENASMWLSEYDVDGLRFDAVHEIKSEDRDLFLGELAEACRGVKEGGKLVLENMENVAHWLERDADNEPKTYTAQWNDGIHHVMEFLVTGERKHGYDDPAKDPIEDLRIALADGFVEDGKDGSGGTGIVLPPDSFVCYVQNHDQIGNRADSSRMPDRISAERLDFLHFIAFLSPQLPLFFQGEEAHMRTPFPYFVDLPRKEGDAKDKDRYRQLREIFEEEVEDGGLPHPNDPQTFAMAKLEWSELEQPERQQALERFRTLARYRREIVWPLSATRYQRSVSIRRGNGLIVTWFYEGGALTMALNPSPMPIDMECFVNGMPVATGDWCTHGELLRLDRWSAIAWNNR